MVSRDYEARANNSVLRIFHYENFKKISTVCVSIGKKSKWIRICAWVSSRAVLFVQQMALGIEFGSKRSLLVSETLARKTWHVWYLIVS